MPDKRDVYMYIYIYIYIYVYIYKYAFIIYTLHDAAICMYSISKIYIYEIYEIQVEVEGGAPIEAGMSTVYMLEYVTFL